MRRKLLPSITNNDNKPLKQPEWISSNSSVQSKSSNNKQMIPEYHAENDRYNLTAKLRKFNIKQKEKSSLYIKQQSSSSSHYYSDDLNSLSSVYIDYNNTIDDDNDKKASEAFIFRLIRARESILSELYRIITYNATDLLLVKSQVRGDRCVCMHLYDIIIILVVFV